MEETVLRQVLNIDAVNLETGYYLSEEKIGMKCQEFDGMTCY